ncbi:MAG: anhydro-N-acetylmuramic acid kinase [Armatimonadetes bacterium]|nr:anhydro-N-acetylmuramic acid kinase [Armatimonadota bacterium]
MHPLEAFQSHYRRKNPRRLVGLMSGTSADGIDAALVEVEGVGEDLSVGVMAGLEIPYADLRETILSAASGNANAEALCLLNVAVAEAFADAARQVAEAAGMSLRELDAIGSHGQTVWHAPEPLETGGYRVTGSLQIGNGSVLSVRTGCVVVSDFRSADMAWGGQGAPLVPLADWLLFRSLDRSRAIQNLGGIANVTFLPAGGSTDEVLAFDTGPGNMVLDALAARLTGGKLRYDANGELALRGTVCEPLLEELLNESYFSRKPPKSTGRERFNAAYVDRLWERGRALNLSVEDLMTTATALTAESIARAYREFLPGVDEVILGGGGVRNPALRQQIEQRLSPTPVRTHEDLGWDGGLKEAVAFALLADRTLQGLPGNLPQVTGAKRAAVLGSISFPSCEESFNR